MNYPVCSPGRFLVRLEQIVIPEIPIFIKLTAESSGSQWRCRGEMRPLCWAVQGAWSLRTSLRPLDFIVIVYISLLMFDYYPARVCTSGVKRLLLSVCLSVCPSKVLKYLSNRSLRGIGTS